MYVGNPYMYIEYTVCTTYCVIALHVLVIFVCLKRYVLVVES